MASNYAKTVSSAELSIIRSALAILVQVLGPYRGDVVISKKLFGFFSINVTIGDILDFLVNNFGTTSVAPIA